MKIEQKRWYLFYFAFLGVLLSVVATFVFIVDPYQHFRENSYHLCYNNEDYFNSGIAKNYTFDSIISGSSMMENFNLDDVQNLLLYQNSIKLTSAGGSIADHEHILKLALQHNSIKNILLGVDIFAFKGPPTPSTRIPEHLYNESLLDDYKYLINISNIRDAIKILRHKQGKGPRCQLNKMYQWQHEWENRFGKNMVLDMWKNGKGAFNSDFKASDYTHKMLQTNLERYLVPLVRDNQETLFTLILPPYSILTFKDIAQKQWLEQALAFRLELVRSLSVYPNVQIYDFQMVKSITHDLNNYKDLSHYHQKVNYWILEQIKANKYRVDERAIMNNNKDLRQQLINLDNNISFWNSEKSQNDD